MSDQESIIQLVRAVERRVRAGELIGKLAAGLAAVLGFLVVFKLIDLLIPFSSLLVRGVLLLSAVAYAAFAVWIWKRAGTVEHAVSVVDKKAGLADELRSAYWFIHSNRRSEWIDLQIARAAKRARAVDVGRLFPVRLPISSYAAGGLLAALIVLNFAPLPWNHNWLYSSPSPVFQLTDAEKRIVERTQELLKRAQELEKTDIAQQIEEIIKNLEQGKISPAEAMQQLQAMQGMLEEGNLDIGSINEGLQEMSEDLMQSESTLDLGSAMGSKDLSEAAQEMRKLADQVGKNMQQSAAKQDMAKTLAEAAENSRAGLESLSQEMKDAAEQMKQGNAQGAKDALDRAANEMQNLAQKMESQQLKNEASKELQNLEDSLRQREQQQQGGNQQAKQQQQQGAPGQQKGEGQGQRQQGGQAPQGEQGQEAAEAGQPGESQDEGANEGAGLMPSGSKTGSSQKEGPATSLEVQLEMEKLTGQAEQSKSDPIKAEEIEESSKQERSKLDYRNVRSELSSAQQDLLNQDRIPWEYRPLIKNYFQAIKPRGKNDR